MSMTDHYESPIRIIRAQMNNDIRDNILQVCQKYSIDIDEEKLVQILRGDRTRYDEAYKKGYADGMNYFKEKLMRRFAKKMYKELMEGDFEDEEDNE